jgi:hypothetical protein
MLELGLLGSACAMISTFLLSLGYHYYLGLKPGCKEIRSDNPDWELKDVVKE